MQSLFRAGQATRLLLRSSSSGKSLRIVGGEVNGLGGEGKKGKSERAASGVRTTLDMCVYILRQSMYCMVYVYCGQCMYCMVYVY